MDTVARISIDAPAAVLGDIHGRADLLAQVLLEVGERQLIVVGDVVDRGHDARQVVDTLVARGAVGVRGNHEEWLLAWMRGEGLDDWAIKPKFGGMQTLRSYGVTGTSFYALEAQSWRIPIEHRRFFESLAIAADVDVMGDRYWLAHAGVPLAAAIPGVAGRDVMAHLVASRPRDLLWSRRAPENMVQLDRTVIMGHVPREEPIDTGGILAIDTGAGTMDRGRLTALLLPERRFVISGR